MAAPDSGATEQMSASTYNLIRRTVLASIVVLAAAIGLVISAARDGDETNLTELAATSDGVIPEPANPAPLSDVELVTFDGETVTLADFRGRPVVVNFWASWCPACIAEMPAFETVHQAFGDEVVFVGLAIQDERSAAEDLAAETGVTYLLAEDPPGDFFETYGGIAMPTTVFLTPAGEVAERHSGILTEGSLTDKINELLEPVT